MRFTPYHIAQERLKYCLEERKTLRKKDPGYENNNSKIYRLRKRVYDLESAFRKLRRLEYYTNLFLTNHYEGVDVKKCKFMRDARFLFCKYGKEVEKVRCVDISYFIYCNKHSARFSVTHYNYLIEKGGEEYEMWEQFKKFMEGKTLEIYKDCGGRTLGRTRESRWDIS